MLKKVFKWNTKALLLEGHIDFVSNTAISGWFLEIESGSVLNATLYNGKNIIGECKIDSYREDLNALGKINPNSGFTMELTEGLDFSNTGSYALYINDQFSEYATTQLRNVIGQLVQSRFNPADDIEQLKRDREWLIKMREEDSQEIDYLNKCESLLEKVLVSDGNDLVTYNKEYRNLKDDKEFSALLSLDMPYDDKKAGFSHIASTILQRDLDEGFIDLKFNKPSNPTVSIILVLYNKAELTYQCLKSIKQETSTDFELIVIDNDSTDQTAELMALVEGVTYIKNSDNIGFLKACNQARQYVTGEYIFLLNNDAVIKNGTLKAGVDVFSLGDDIGVVGGAILHLDGKLQEAGSIIWSDASCLGYGRREDPNHYKYTYRRQVDYVSGALFFTPVSLWDELGGFDERLAPCYYEETDFCIRVAKRGLKVIMEPKCQITHFEFGSSSHSDFAVKQMQKNKLVIEDIHSDYLAKKYDPKPENIELAANISSKKTVLYMDDQVPFDMLGAGFPRAKDVILEIEKNANVIMYPFCENSDWGDMSLYDNVMLLPFAEHEAIEYLQMILNNVDVVWVSRPHNMEKLIARGWLDIFKGHGIPVVYDAEALFSEREKIRCQLKGLEYDPSLAENEFKLIESADYVVAVSESEKSKITSRIDKNVYVVGHPCTPKVVNKELCNEILFVGNLMGSALESPNVDSVDEFLNDYQHILESNNITLVLVGKIDDANKARWESKNVVVKGGVDSLGEHFERALCSIAPTRFAAGIPHKIHESLSWSTPVLATELILEQCGFEVSEKGGLLTVDNLLKVCGDRIYRNDLFENQSHCAKNDMSMMSFVKNITCIVEVV